MEANTENTKEEQTPANNNFLLVLPTEAERLRNIAEVARSRTLPQRYAHQSLKKAQELAEDGITEFKDKIMTRAFFKENKLAFKAPEGVELDDYLETVYNAQKECYELLEKEGFKVTYSDLDLPSTLDINMDATTRRMVEDTKRLTESMVTVSWG